MNVVKAREDASGLIWVVCDDGTHAVFHVAGDCNVGPGDQLTWGSPCAHPIVTNLSRGREILHMDSAVYGLSPEAAAACCRTGAHGK